MSSFLSHNNKPFVADRRKFGLDLDKQNNQQIWAIGGGKGGVGKSLVTANISICLALMGYKVTSIDLDEDYTNLHKITQITQIWN